MKDELILKFFLLSDNSTGWTVKILAKFTFLVERGWPLVLYGGLATIQAYSCYLRWLEGFQLKIFGYKQSSNDRCDKLENCILDRSVEL